jgi:hypothetical protein
MNAVFDGVVANADLVSGVAGPVNGSTLARLAVICGQWAIFFRVVLSDDATTDRLREITNQVIWRMSEELDLPNLGLFPHFDFRSESEQAALNEAECARTA